MPPQQTCCCKDGEEPCPNCYEGATFGCSPPCCWCTGLIGKCEGEAGYGAALDQCYQDWLDLGWEGGPCSDTFQVTVAVPDDLKTTYSSYPIDPDPDPGEPLRPTEPKQYTEAVYQNLRLVDSSSNLSYTVESNDARWVTNATTTKTQLAGIWERNTGYSPPYLPDATHIGKSCPASNSITCQSSGSDSCVSNAGYCCKSCSEDGVDDCEALSGYNFGLYGKQSHYDMLTTTLWYKTAQSTAFTVGVDSRGNLPCRYTGLSDVVGTGTVVYLGRRNQTTQGFDTNCPGYPCDCDEDECQNCLHCTEPNCLVCKDKYCKNENPDIGWGGMVDHADFDVYQVPINWKVRYDLWAEKFNSNLTDEKYHWVQRVYLEYEEDWSGITVDPATQGIGLAPAIPTEQFWQTPFDTDCGQCPRAADGSIVITCEPGDEDYPCECPVCLSWGGVQIQDIISNEEKRDPSDLDRCAYILNYIRADLCEGLIPSCDGTVPGSKRYEVTPSIWQTNPETFTVPQTVTRVYGSGGQCSEVLSVSTKVYHNTADYLYNNQLQVAAKSGPRIQNCDQSCAKCDDDGGAVDCSWEYNDFVVSITGLGD